MEIPITRLGILGRGILLQELTKFAKTMVIQIGHLSITGLVGAMSQMK